MATGGFNSMGNPFMDDLGNMSCSQMETMGAISTVEVERFNSRNLLSIEVASGVAQLNENLSISLLLKFFTLGSSSFIVLINVYFLIIVLSDEELRTLKYYHATLMSFCDLLIGLSTLYVKCCDLVTAIEWTFDVRGYSLGNVLKGPAAQFIREHVFWDYLHFYHLSMAISQSLNQYSTGICILGMAVERYIFVTWPREVEKLLSKRNRVIHCVFTTCFIILCFLPGMPCHLRMLYYPKMPPEYCIKYYILSKLKPFEMGIFYFLPAVVAVVLYVFVIQRLLKMQSHVERNKNLTICFLVTCIFWIILWLPESIGAFANMYGVTLQNVNSFFLFLCILAGSDLRILYSAVNPIIFMFICKPFSKPLRSIAEKIGSLFGKRSSGDEKPEEKKKQLSKPKGK